MYHFAELYKTFFALKISTYERTKHHLRKLYVSSSIQRKVPLKVIKCCLKCLVNMLHPLEHESIGLDISKVIILMHFTKKPSSTEKSRICGIGSITRPRFMSNTTRIAESLKRNYTTISKRLNVLAMKIAEFAWSYTNINDKTEYL